MQSLLSSSAAQLRAHCSLVHCLVLHAQHPRVQEAAGCAERFVEWSVGALERDDTLVTEAPALVRRCAAVAQAVFPAPDAVLARLIHAIFTTVRRHW